MLLGTRLKCGERFHRYVTRSFTSLDTFIFHVRFSVEHEVDGIVKI